MKKLIILLIIVIGALNSNAQTKSITFNAGLDKKYNLNIGIIENNHTYSTGFITSFNIENNRNYEENGIYLLLGPRFENNLVCTVISGIYYSTRDNNYWDFNYNTKFDIGYYVYYTNDKYSFGIKQTYHSDIAVIFGINILNK